MNSLELKFRRYLIDLILEWLSGQRTGGAELTRETTLAVLPYGQVTQTPSGVRFTKKQASLLPRRGLETNIITVHGRRYVGALGDTRKRTPSRPVPARGGGAFPVPLPYQPVINATLAELQTDAYTFGGEPVTVTAWVNTFLGQGNIGGGSGGPGGTT